MTIEKFALRLMISASLAVSGVVHAYLWATGYSGIPTVGPAFLLQASVFSALAVLILVGGPTWLEVLGALGAAGSLVAFALSRTVGLFGFIETGWEPSPYTWISVVTELATVVLVGAVLVRGRSRRTPLAGRTWAQAPESTW
jgi:hypothetical protein